MDLLKFIAGIPQSIGPTARTRLDQILTAIILIGLFAVAAYIDLGAPV